MNQLSFLTVSQNKINVYLELLEKWQKAVNLVASSTLSDAWTRHVLDSAQLYPLIPSSAKTLVDMGSGAGFPGLLLAILNHENKGGLNQIVLVESDLKKCLFLREVARQVGVPVTVLNQRLESVSGIKADVVTARGLASFPQLLLWGKPVITPKTTCLFLKGEREETSGAEKIASFRCEKIKSITNSNSFIVKVTEVIYAET